MIDPFSATTLGGLAYDTAKAAITKWVGARIAAGFSTALQNREFKHGRPTIGH